jgi:serine/threonine-protein phosphatase 5
MVTLSARWRTFASSSVVDEDGNFCEVPPTSKGDITPFYVKNVVLDVFAKGKLFPESDISLALRTVKKRLKAFPNVISTAIPTEGRLNIVGDLHGQFRDLCSILSEDVGGFPSEKNLYIFNGDFVDRGEDSLAVIVTLLCLKLAFPKFVHLLRGNHEAKDINAEYGFKDELRLKNRDCHESLGMLFDQVFCALPLAVTIENEAFVVHGGIGPISSEMKIADLNKINRFKEPRFKHLGRPCAMTELLWAGTV